jgi:hypothetical protein
MYIIKRLYIIKRMYIIKYLHKYLIILSGLRTSGIEPELCDWKSHSLPLTYVRA